MPLTGSLRTLLLRGLLAGLIAGLLAGTVGFVVGEPKVESAIALEEAGAEHGHSHEESEEPLVSRGGQKFGEFLALGLSGLALGAIFAAVANIARRHTGLSGPKLAVLLGLCGWLAISAVPFFKYPANPPAVGEPDTINDRTLLWAASVLVGLAAVGAAVFAHRLLAAQLSTLRVTAAVVAFLVVTAIGYIVLPGVNEVKDDFPATLLWQFRVSSLAVTATLWAALGLAFATLTEFASRKEGVAA
ncbi:CbtA family protein [Nocardia blacklockiae]|uniref:CbtA family protein n=1 Tax=Nocardia blacklockiae TaxID=480036 RepID=UPI001895E9CF|nr:CbtA family protein [Nocardia blacklockiae]MBF6173174.1 CbtA family protein [Nocardia blacklockiae]